MKQRGKKKNQNVITPWLLVEERRLHQVSSILSYVYVLVMD
jgi:hypothetical protein